MMTVPGSDGPLFVVHNSPTNDAVHLVYCKPEPLDTIPEPKQLDDLYQLGVPDPNSRTYYTNLLHCALIALTGLPLGWDVGTMGHVANSGEFAKVFGTNGESLSPLVLGSIISSLNLGCIIGAIIIGTLDSASKINAPGMRKSIWVSTSVYALGTFIETISAVIPWKIWVLYSFGRLLCGICIGSLATIGPVYIGNIVKTPSMKKTCMSWHQNACCFAILLGNLIIIWLGQNQNILHAMVAFKAAFSIIIPIAIYFVPEWKNSRINEIDAQKSEILSGRESTNHRSFSWKVKRLWTKLRGSTIMCLQQFSGINFYFYYSAMIFHNMPPAIASTILSGFNFGASLFSGILLENFGTRNSLFVGAIIMGICMGIFALLGNYVHNDNGIGLIVVVTIYIIVFALSWGPGASVLVNELSSSSQAMSIAVCFNWISNFMVNILTPILSKSLGYSLGWIFSIFLFTAAMVIYRRL
ncbi:hexose transporter Hxt14p [[Candida] anglica]|uniref:Hexose transporter Hxt14p n=1 Tax=[Candida] anglica TaxID=148631 RepID=A0ABP0EEL4_9ASCO